MDYIVDLQGFRRSSNIFVLKELAYVPVQEDVSPTALLFDPPCKWSRLLEEERQVNGWLEQNYHGIPWRNGDIPYQHVVDVLQSTFKDASRIYVKGLEKKNWLQEMIPRVNVYDLDEICQYTLKQLNEGNSLYCDNHILCDYPICAVKNADALRKWLLQYRRKREELEQGDYDEDDYDEDDYIPPSQIYVY